MDYTFLKSEIIEAVKKCLTDKELRKERYPFDPYMQYRSGYTRRCDEQKETIVKNIMQQEISELRGILLILERTEGENITLSHKDIALFAEFIKK